MTDKTDKKISDADKKKKYIKPEITSEPLMTFGAVCNGVKKAPRKRTTSAPDFCNISKLLS